MKMMKCFAIAGVLAVIASPALAASKMPDSKMSNSKMPNSALACWQPAFEAMDSDAVVNCYTPDAVLWLPGAPMMQGRDAIRAGYVGYFSDFTVKSMTLVEMGKSSRGDEASSWGSFTLVTVAKADGKETTEHGRYTDVSRRVAGKWMFLVDHASDDPAPAPAPPPPPAPAPAAAVPVK